MGSRKAALGIDPGGSGCAGVLTKDRTLFYCRFQKGWQQTADWFTDISLMYNLEALSEQVGTRPKDSKPRAKQFGRNQGIVEGMMYTHHIPFIEIPPKEWQYVLKLGGRFGPPGCSDEVAKKLRKAAQKELAQKLFPQVKVTLDMADGLLITEVQWRRMFKGE